jgi:outer membrane biosynthesis protein TonB
MKQSQDADPSEALVAEWLAKEQQDKQAKPELEHKSESKETEATEEEKEKEKEVSEEPVKKTKAPRQTGRNGKARRGQRRRAQKRQDKGKEKERNDTDDEEEAEDANLRRFRESEECYSYMREVMVRPLLRYPSPFSTHVYARLDVRSCAAIRQVELEPHIRFPLIAPHWLIKIERDKLITRALLTEVRQI